MADMPANASPPRPASSSKSSPRARIRSALLFCRAEGWSSGSLPGSAATEGLPKISRPASTPPGPSFTPLPSCCSHAASRGTHEFRNRLLGDPKQLEQPVQGSHPKGTDVSALDHILGGHPTIPVDRGLFLEETWRLHPDICAFTSELFYENRLHPHPGLERQKIKSDRPNSGNGVEVSARHARRKSELFTGRG